MPTWRDVDLSKKVDEVLGRIEERLNGLLRQAASPRPAPGLQQLMAASSQIHAAWPSRTAGQGALLQRLGDLRRLLSGLPQTSGWTDMLTELEQLEKEAAHPESLGGRFEWRDSVLVTSLIHGDWLLLENVNLCSASVLDRLNGLLEPDGVLPLTEQGVVGEALRVVRPHPDFRLIMTMDPRHGEISRAMRNRAVEVYLPGEEDGGTLDLWDTQALLASAGLLQPGLSGPLYEAHRAFSAASATLNNLRQAVALSVHRLESGVLPLDAVRSSFAETHLVAWDSREEEVACQSLEGVSWKGTQLPQAQQLLLSLVASPPLWALERHCEAAQIWSDSLALCAVLATLSEPSRVVLPMPLELQGVEPQSLLGMATRLLLEPCTHNNLSLRISWLQHMARSFGYPPELEPFLRLQLLLRQWDLEARLPTLVEPRDPKAPRLGDPLSRMLAAFIDWLTGAAPVEEIYSKARLAQEHIERLWQACSEPDTSHCLTAPRSARIAQHWSWLRKALRHLTPHKDARPEDDSDSLSLASTVARVDQCLLDHLALHQHKLRNRVAKRLGQDLLATLEKELLPVEEDNEKMIARAAVGPVDALRDLVQLVEESPALESFLEGRTEGSLKRGTLWHPLHGAASALALGKDLPESNRKPLLGEVSAWWVEHLCGLWDTPTHLGVALAQSVGWQDRQAAAGWLEGHQVYLSPLMTVTCCAMADGPGFHLGLGDRTPKCAELEAQRRLLARGTDPRTLWTSQAATLEQWFSQLVSTLPGFAGREGDWWIQLDIPEEFRLLVRDAAQQLRALADSRPWSPERLWCLGLAWARVGLCSLQLLVPWDPVDPVYKVALKVAHVEKELLNRDAEQRLRHWAHRAHTGKPPCYEGHPALALEAACRQQLATQLQRLCTRKAHRGPNSQYEELAHQMRHCAATLGSKERVGAVLQGLENAWQGSRAPDAEAWSCLAAQEATVRRLRLEHPTFRDLCYPFLCGLAQMAQGIRVLATLASSRSCTSKDPRRELVLCQGLMFPTGMSPKAVSDLLCGSQASTLASSGSQRLLLLRSALLELVNGRLSDHARTTQWLRAARPVLGQLVHAWQQNEEEERQKQEKEQSLYQYRCHAGEASQEELDEQQRRALFPSYAEEFEEEKDILETKEQPCVVPPAAFGEKEASEVWQCHAVLADPGKPLGSVDWLGALELRCRALRDSVRQLGPSLDPELDLELLGSHMVSCWSLEQHLRAPERNAAEEAVKGRQFDLYHDSVLEEMALCERPLRCIMARAKALLEQFPGHPGLTRLLQVCRRVLSLEVSSPLMRVLQGLEMLLVVGQEWENGAHRNISLSAELNEITQLVVRWRKLELQGWSRCLDSVQQKRRDGQARWWFFLHQLLAPLIQKSKSSLDDKTRQRVGDELVRFLGECRLGDLESRLDLVRPFLHEALASKAPLRGLLFNLCHFYGQYLPAVQARIQRDREPIEKKLKDGVPRYARRMRQLLGRVLRNDALAELTLELDQLAGQVVATVLDFEKQDAMLGRPGPKGDPEADKRRQQARLAQQLKRKALADLLKALAQLGLSHRKGQLRGATPRSMLEAPALELSATLRDGAAGAALESNWQGCHSYYYRSVAGLSTLAASCPSKELDPQLMDRCCGFAAHLATLAVEDRTRSCEVLANLEKLRALSTSVELAAKGPLLPQAFLDHWKGKVAATLSQAAMQLDQVLVLLRAWPRDEAAPVQVTELAVGRLQAHLAPLEQCARLLAPPATRGLLGHPEPDLLEGAVQQLAALSREAHQSSGTLCPPLARHLWALAEPLDVLAEDWAQARAPSPDGKAPPSDALARRLLVAVQRLYGHLGGAPGDPASGPHLTLLRDNLQEAFVRMDLERTCKLTGRLVRHLRQHGVDENASRACDAVVPLLRQYLGACRHLASLQLAAHRSGLKLLHILASLFSTLAKKGLCLPEEWREELEREGAPELQELEDGGLGEGEGAKDVSDRIESQDQLEGTRSEQKEEPEEEQRAPKDEEHGVEMTEDFEAPAQDPEEGEGEEGDESEEEDEDELDDQMGDVQGDDQLDQEEPQLGARDEDAAPQREEPAGAPPEDEKAPDDGPEVAPEGPPDDSTIGEPPDPQVTVV
ncbi:midasin, putative [Ixodes scapularis]|uniref:Midasin, putative n=1 Tax=Ixodes scapularis TaxID=6945 RepID=B7PT78_IXOSC|nr:midasin, putative [Ixodes scapularis]|eukprot:XP_002403985.1 midasin, putative [Ixodes scapularis]